MEETKEKQEKISIPHKEANNFGTYFSNGTILSIMENNSCQLIFYADVININSETGVQEKSEAEEPGAVRAKINKQNITPMREDQCRIIMSESNIKALYRLLHKHYGL